MKNINDYITLMPFPISKHFSTKDDYYVAMKNYKTSVHNVNMEFKNDLFADYGVADNPKAELCWNMAWDRGHSEGLSAVSDQFDELVELIL